MTHSSQTCSCEDLDGDGQWQAECKQEECPTLEDLEKNPICVDKYGDQKKVLRFSTRTHKQKISHYFQLSKILWSFLKKGSWVKEATARVWFASGDTFTSNRLASSCRTMTGKIEAALKPAI